MRWWKQGSAAAAIAMVVLLLVGGLAAADNISASGDDVTTTGSTTTLAFGTVCAGTTITKNVDLVVTKTGGGTNNNNNFKNGSVVTFSAGSVSGAGVSVVGGPTPSSLTLPTGWSSRPTNTTEGSSTVQVQLVAGSPRAVVGAVPVHGIGVNSDNDPLTRSVTVNVTGTVVSCDTTPPALQLPAGIAVEATGPTGAVVTYSATASDANPASPAVACMPASGSTFAIQTTTVNCSSTDAAGNTATGSFPVTVADTTAPAIGTAADITAEATSAAGASVTYVAPTAADLVDGPRPVSCIPASGSVVPLGTTTVTCTALDTRGNSSSSSFSVTVADATKPMLQLPGAITAEATSPAGAAVDFVPAPTASDTVAGAVEVVCTSESGATFALGSTTVDCSATDGAGNTQTGSFSVSVSDTTKPVLTVPTPILAEAADADGAAVSYSASAADLVDDDVDVSCSHASGATFPIGTTAVQCSATDDAGNIGTASFNVTVADTTAPTLHLGADVTVEATGPDGATAVFEPSGVDAVDGVVTVVCAPASGAGFPVGTTSVTCSASDSRGNRAQGELIVKVVDTTAPLLTVPTDVLVEADGPDGAPVEFTASATDVVDTDVEVGCDAVSGDTFSLGTTTVTCTATDDAGNPATATFAVTVDDTTAPSIGDLAVTLAEATGPGGAVVGYDVPTASDVVDGTVAVTCTPLSGSTFALGSNDVTCSATDAHGNSASRTFTITIADTTAPIISAPQSVTAEATGPSGAPVTFVVTASDLVDGDVDASCEPPSGSNFDLGATAVTCGAEDLRGNGASKSFTVTVVDTTPPDLVVPASITAEATEADGATVTYSATATDVVDGTVTPDCDVASGTTFHLGETLVTCTAVDDAGNASEKSFTVVVQDTTAPTLTVPGDLTAEATGPSGASVSYVASALDIVDGNVVPACTHASGSTFSLGATTVTCSATDTRGNSASKSFIVTVQDTTAPAVTVPEDMSAEATGPEGAAVTFAASALDVVDGSLLPACTPTSGSVFALGTTTVACSVTDAAGNTGSAAFSVAVVDTTGPTVGQPASVTAEATGPNGSVVTYDAPSAHDLVDGDVAVTCAPPSGSTFALGDPTTVTCTAVDSRDNEGTSSFTVTVTDTTAPALAIPADLEVEATGPTGAIVAFAASATDLVDGAVGVTCTPPSGSTFAIAATSVSCSTADTRGNETTGDFTVTVVDTTAPALAVPSAITVEATGASGAAVSFTATASDIVDGAVTPSCSAGSGSMFPLGTTTVTCTANDTRGNTGSGSFDVTVVDTTAPTLTLPSSFSVWATSPTGAPVSYTARATDVVAGAVAVTCTPASGSTFAPGPNTVSCVAADGYGNTGAGTFIVTVEFDLRGGLLSPVNSNVLNTVRAGATVPLKWQMPTPGGGSISDIQVVSRTVVAQVSCGALGTTLDEVAFTTSGGTSLRYDSTADQFIQNWQTPRQPGKCYRVQVLFVGGQSVAANFQLK